MCGISIAINTKNYPVDLRQIKNINDKVIHRGPDDEGFYFGKNFAFGHRRLSIIDLSKNGHQPMVRENLCITYNGEIYNYIELRNELMNLGHVFRSASDTEVILAAYHQWGVESFKKLNGMWAFALADESTNEIILCRDHFGIKPLYLTATENYFLAGSEIKQFTAVPEFKPVLNKPVAAKFLVHGLLNYSDQTFFEGVSELRPGHYLKYHLSTNHWEVKPWYDLAQAVKPVHDSFDEAVKKTRALFLDSLKLRMRSDVRVGSCLSGGVDSSAIVSVIAGGQLANTNFATITSCYDDQRYDEQQFSNLVTAQTGYKAIKVFPQLEDLLQDDVIDKMIYHQDQPFSTASHFSEYKVFEAARKEKMIVMLDGQGSDEYLCGYPEFYNATINNFFCSVQWGKMIKAISEKAKHKQVSFLNEIIQLGRTNILYPALHLYKKLIGRQSPEWLNEKWANNLESNAASSNDIRKLSIEEMVRTSIPYQLHSEDRNSMLFSIESRLPFLDHRLVEYCIGLPSSYKIRNGFTKAVFREAISELPQPIKNRKDKMGFVAPDAEWMLQHKDLVREDLKEAIARTGAFSEKLLHRFDRFAEGKKDYETIYFRAMTFNRFCKIFNMTIDQ